MTISQIKTTPFSDQKPGTSDFLTNLVIRYSSAVISGYANATSLNKGGNVALKVSTSQPGTYSIDVYRLGYYGGTGGRLVASSGSLNGVTQTPCAVTDAATHLIECAWSTSYTINVGADWTTGIYLAKLVHTATLKEFPIYFVVRDDSSNLSDWFYAEFTPRGREDAFAPAASASAAPGAPARDARDQLF